MTEKLAQWFAAYFSRSGLIKEDDRDLYALGFDVILSTLFTSVVILFFGLVGHNLPGSVVFLLCFMHIRNYSGGYHAKSRGMCFVVSVSCYLASWAAVRLLSVLQTPVRTGVILIVVVFTIVVFWLRAPVENKNKRLPSDWKRRNRIRSFAALGLWLVIAGVLFWFWPALAWQIVAAAGIIAILLLGIE